MAAPPVWKFATICLVTDCGKAETFWFVIPWFAAKMASRGWVIGLYLLQVAYHSVICSRVPSDFGGFVSLASRVRAVCRALVFGWGRFLRICVISVKFVVFILVSFVGIDLFVISTVFDFGKL